VCLYTCVHAGLDGPVFTSLSIIGRCPLSMDILAQKIINNNYEYFRLILMYLIMVFSKTDINILIKFQYFMDVIALNETE
jgi:hypothetical protein